jgi:hypothetical protein
VTAAGIARGFDFINRSVCYIGVIDFTPKFGGHGVIALPDGLCCEIKRGM